MSGLHVKVGTVVFDVGNGSHVIFVLDQWRW